MPDPMPAASSRTSGEYALLAVGGLLLTVLWIWVILTFVSKPLVPRLPEIPGLARSGEESGLPSREMESAIEQAKQAMYAKYRAAHNYGWSSRLVDWVGFGLTSAITLIAGALGRGIRPGEDPASAAREALEAGSTRVARRLLTVVGVVAAMASVMIGLGSRLQSESQGALDRAEKLRVLITASSKDFLNAQSPEEAMTVVSNLDAETRKNE